MIKINILDGFEIKKAENGTFSYTPKPLLLQPKVKKQYKDPYHFPLVETIEKSFKNDTEKMINNIGIQTLKLLQK